MNSSLDSAYWDHRYRHNKTSWDTGSITPPLKAYIDQLTDKDIRILIPGCGNGYEAGYLLENGFTNITVVDISLLVTEKLKQKFRLYNGNELTVIAGDFFKVEEHFDLIIEQTFFCAIEPTDRRMYVIKVASLLNPCGKIAGVLFDRRFQEGPPFGGNKDEYFSLFSPFLIVKTLEPCYNSIQPRQGSELFMIFQKYCDEAIR